MDFNLLKVDDFFELQKKSFGSIIFYLHSFLTGMKKKTPFLLIGILTLASISI